MWQALGARADGLLSLREQARRRLELTRRISMATGCGWIVFGVCFLFLATRLTNPMTLVVIGIGVVELAFGCYFLRRARRFH